MLLIDGVKYQEWTPTSEKEFEWIVSEHASEIFGENSMYIDRKLKLQSLSGIGSIPDGYVIVFGGSPEWHIVEVELSSHPLYEHIVSQVSRFINGISNPNTQRGIVNAIDDEIRRDDFLRLRLKKAVEPTEIYKFLSDLISKQPILTIIIEKDTEELREALTILRYPQIKVVEFKTFVREGVGLAVHAHLFNPLYQAPPKDIIITEVTKEEFTTTRKAEKRITVKNLIDAAIIKQGQIVYGWYEGKKYEGEVLNNGNIAIRSTGDIFDSPSGAASHIKGYQEDGWRWWHTIHNGKEYKLAELREEHKATHP